jgi:hypothetical protein
MYEERWAIRGEPGTIKPPVLSSLRGKRNNAIKICRYGG